MAWLALALSQLLPASTPLVVADLFFRLLLMENMSNSVAGIHGFINQCFCYIWL
jgi:hypothetical protein